MSDLTNSLSNMIRFSFFNIESDEEEIVLIAAAIHSLKKKKNNGNNKKMYCKKRSVLQKEISIHKTLLGDTLLNELRIEKHSEYIFF